MNWPEKTTLPQKLPPLDRDFRPPVLENRAFREAVDNSGQAVPLYIALERNDGKISTYETRVFDESSPMSEANYFFVERLVKTLLWSRGGWKLTISGPLSTGEYIKKAYSPGGLREFDAHFMSHVYEKPFTVELASMDQVPAPREESRPVGGDFRGNRIGFDAGGSDLKVSAVVDGEAIYSEERVWHPKENSDPDYHYGEILAAMKTAASYLPRVDAIGVSSAGIYIDNRAMAASLFIKVPNELFEEKVKDIYLQIQQEFGGVPMVVANDGDVTALAGSMDLEDGCVLGIAMGTSEAGGYVDKNGNITGWLNELAFMPVDYNPSAMTDEWSGDFGCGVKYFSQDGVTKLAPVAGIELDDKLTPAEKLKEVQNLLDRGDKRARQVFESIGCYLGYTLPHYAEFYDVKNVLLLGRVTSGEGGNIIYTEAEKILSDEFPDVHEQIKIHLPDESTRRVGQSIAAASLPQL